MDHIDIGRRRMLLAGMLASAMPIRALAMPGATAPDVEETGRIDGLLARMTLAEKVGQLTIMPSASASAQATAANPEFRAIDAAQRDAVAAGRIGALFNSGDAKWYRDMQTVAVERSRLKIPLLFACDVIHGFRTIFPVPLGEAASFDLSLAERTARAAAVECSDTGIRWTFAPMVDVARDARWGRGVEGAGEDVLLNARMAEARVRGFHGRQGLHHHHAVLATPKHFAAYGAAQGGLDYAAVDISEQTLREVYLPPFATAFAAGALTTMAAFHAFDGVPVHANRWLLTDILRGDMGFDGLVVSDWEADLELIAHGVARDRRDAARLAIMAGVDMSMTSGLYNDHLPSLVDSGDVPMARVDQAVRRVLTLKSRLGLFDRPYVRRGAITGDAPRFRSLAREAAAKSCVLLKNDGDLLPLAAGPATVALIGPLGSGRANLHGTWSVFGDDRHAVPLDTAMRDAMRPGARLIVEPGCMVEDAIDGGIARAVAAARIADVVVLAIGEGEIMSGEGQSRTSIALPEAQVDLARAVVAVGTPVVVALRNGRAMAIDPVIRDAAQAILVTWFPGTEGGNAIADVLFGRVGPQGRLPVSFPLDPGQVPFFYAQSSTGRPSLGEGPNRHRARYREVQTEAAWPFGHGLTYGRITYTDLRLSTATLSDGETLAVTARLTNSGLRDAVEVVQLYIRDRIATTVRPIRQLVDFRHLALAPGETRTVVFEVRAAQLRFVGNDMAWRTAPGAFDLWVAPSATTGLHGSFHLVAESGTGESDAPPVSPPA